MNIVIVIFSALLALLGFATWQMARAATSDGDYTFLFPAAGSAIVMVILAILLAIKFL